MGYQNFFATKLFTDIGAGDTTITLETPPAVTSGRLTLEARNPTQKEIIRYTGVSGNQITGVTRGQGGTTAKSHVKNALVEMNATGEDLQDILDAFASFAASANDWRTMVPVVTSITNEGSRSQLINFNSSISALLSPGMRVRGTRSVALTAQSAQFVRASSQHANRTASINGLSFTDDITIEADIYLDSYGNNPIFTRYNGSNGFELYCQSNGRLYIIGFNGSNVNYKQVITNQAIPLKRWVHVSATLDMSSFTSATNKIYLDGEEVPCDLNSSGTNPTSLVQGGNLAIGSSNGTTFGDLKISDVKLWSTIRTPAQIRDNATQRMVGNEAGLLGYWTLAGTWNDLTANANHLTAVNGAINNFAAIPYGNGGASTTQEFGVITQIVSSTQIRVQTPEGSKFPVSGGLASFAYSGAKTPFGFPMERFRWLIQVPNKNDENQIGSTNNVWYNLGKHQIVLPIGIWKLTQTLTAYRNTGGAVATTISTANNSESDADASSYAEYASTGGASPMFREVQKTLTAKTTFYLNTWSNTGSANIYNFGARTTSVLQAENMYV